MTMAAQFPRWLSEFRRSQTLKSVVFLHGNIYDSHCFPTKLETPDSKWAVFSDSVQLLQHYLRQDGYELVTYYDQVDGLEVRHCSDDSLNTANLLPWLSDNNKLAAQLPKVSGLHPPKVAAQVLGPWWPTAEN